MPGLSPTVLTALYLVIFVVACFAVYYLYFYEKPSESFRETEKDGGASSKKEKAQVLLFKASWCSWCTEFAPIWDEFCKKVASDASLKGVECVKYDVDDVKSKPLLDKYEVKSLPDVRFVIGDKVIKFEGERTVATLMDGLKKHM
jgi:thiol-disulfide isomerase/thioredoxin